MKSCWKKLLACATALCVSLTGFGLSFCAESDDERLQRVEGDASAEITRVECCGSMNPQYVEAGTALEDLSFTLSVWFEGEVECVGKLHRDSRGNYRIRSFGGRQKSDDRRDDSGEALRI